MAAEAGFPLEALASRVGGSGPLDPLVRLKALARAASSLEEVLAAVLRAVACAGRQCLEEVRRAEGALHGLVARGPLDGVLLAAAAQATVEEALGIERTPPLVARVVGGLVAAEDHHAMLVALGPRGLLRLLDLICRYREATAMSSLGGGVSRQCLASTIID